ncbi:hypothetical protein TIFTF001_031215 [Ficus carica]|uniref:Uncharacterized protein n=1 Tax=Ficus carica TaxID=3494 RepID=A0AA88J4V5_FICCA|nr:hypothetical protein TIFTF001_031215 [Ficus carica]
MNRFHGMIPSNFAKGNYLNVGNNSIIGSFPFWLESLPNLQVLILRSNRFAGPVEFVSPIQRPSWLRHHGFRVSSSKTRTTLPDQTGKGMRGVLEAYSIRILPFRDEQAMENQLSYTNDEAPKDQDGGDEVVHNDNGMIDWMVVMMGYGSGVIIAISAG